VTSSDLAKYSLCSLFAIAELFVILLMSNEFAVSDEHSLFV